MQPMSEGYSDLMDLTRELRSEKLFVEAELDSLRQLNERLERSAVELAQASWTNTQQRCNLRQIVAQGDFASTTCCPKNDYVLSPVFIDAHKVLRYQDALVLSEVIGRIRLNPGVASAWLVAAEHGQSAGTVARALTSGVYAGDCRRLRDVLIHLARHSLATAEDPRRMVVMGNSSFSRLYSELVEGFHPARVFLSAALKAPMLPLLQLDEYLIVDADKAMDRVKKYCSPNGNSSEYQQKLAKYRKWTVTSLVSATKRFIVALTEHWACFPPTIAWVVRQTAIALRESGRVSEEDIHSICTDLVFTNFICQAVMNPEAYGITDIPITNIERFNLVQVAQTLQILCLSKHQETDGKLRDLYSRFEKESVFTLLDLLLEYESYSAVPDDCTREEKSFESEDCDELNDAIKTEPVIKPNVALFTRSELQLLVSLLKKLPSNLANGLNTSSHEQRIELLSLDRDFDHLHLTSQDSAVTKKKIKPTNSNASGDYKGKVNGGFSGNGISPDEEMNGDMACGVTPDGCETQGIDNCAMIDDSLMCEDEGLFQILKTVHPDQIARLQALLKRLPDNNFAQEAEKSKPSSKGKHNGTVSNTSSPLKKKGSINSSNTNGVGNSDDKSKNQEVLVIKLQGETPYEPIGLVSESKVLEWHYDGVAVRRAGLPVVPLLEAGTNAAVEAPRPLQAKAVSDESSGPTGTVGVSGLAVQGDQHRGQEKRTRFSLSHDEGSIGNTSDNLEAASNHSVTSSLEMETEDQNDNLSDMVSANVSGRGSPNISGRDTPSSQVTEGDNQPQGLVMPPPHRLPSNAPLNPTSSSKQARLVKRVRNEIDDKFCKFEIKKLPEGDETISIISDTWSTDVLASDSETIGESAYDRSVVIQHHNILAGGGAVNVGPPMQPDASETASESAWSTDALVSDSDRLTEVDMDECNSIGRSDLSASRLDGGTPTHHQFSPHNNINRDSLLNTRQQLSAAVSHEAHPDNLALPLASGLTASGGASSGKTKGAAKLSKTASGGSKDLPTNDASSDSSSNASGGIGVDIAPSLLAEAETFPGDVVLRKSVNGPSSSSLYTEMSSSSDSSNEAANAAALAAFVSDNVIGVVSPSTGISSIVSLGSNGSSGSVSLQNRRPKGYHEHTAPPQALNGIHYDESLVTAANGYHIGETSREFSLPLPKPSLTPESPGAQLENYPLPHPMALAHRPILDNINVFDFTLQENNRNGNNQESGISTPDGMFHPSTSPSVPSINSSATSRWVNDTCQKFIAPRPEPTSTPSKNGNKRSSSQEDISILDNSLGDMKRSNTDSMFRPIRTGSTLSDIDDSGISDLNGCGMMPFLNGTDDISNQDFNSTMTSDISFNNSSNGFGDRFQDSRSEDYSSSFKEDNSDPPLRMTASSVTTQHSFSSTNKLTNTISRVLKTETRTSVINISSSRIDKMHNFKCDSVSHSGSAISLNAMSINSPDSTPTSDRSSTTQEVNSENLTERRISPTIEHVSILNSTDVRMVKGASGGSTGAATLPRNATPCTSLKPNASTGAIPKSISFDATAEKSHRHQHRRFNHSSSHTGEPDLGGEGSSLNFGDLKNNMKKSGGQILNKIKNLKNRSRGFAASAAGFGKRGNQHVYGAEDVVGKTGNSDINDRGGSVANTNRGSMEDANKPIHDLSEDILAKYRRKASSSSSEAANSDTGAQQWNGIGGLNGVSNSRSSQQLLHASARHPDDATNVSDGESAMHSGMAMDAECEALKKKLRKALSNLDTQSIEISAARDGPVSLMCTLRLAGDSYLSAMLPSPEYTHAPPLLALRRDARARRPYLSYLARCRRSLIYTIAHIQSETEWHRSEALRQAGLVAAGRALVSLAGREGRLASLQERLRSGLSDEKRDLLAQTLASLNSEMAREESWSGASEWELEQAALTVERTVMSRVYLQAMFPNGDGDVLRDQLLREHITNLSACHAGLPPLGVRSSVWIPALHSLAQLPAYKAPLDKVRCIQSCIHSIVALLSSLSEAPGADHLTPALVYVVIKVNPQSLLSTIQYVNTFLSSPLEGEQLYCWTQFCSAVEYIKTMDYTRR